MQSGNSRQMELKVLLEEKSKINKRHYVLFSGHHEYRCYLVVNRPTNATQLTLVKDGGTGLLCCNWLASSTSCIALMLCHTFLHSTSGYKTTEEWYECCWGSFVALRLGLAEGLGMHCVWQTHCLKLQEISWATATAGHWYDCCWIYSRPSKWRLPGLGFLEAMTGRCVYSIWGVWARGNDWKHLQCW